MERCLHNVDNLLQVVVIRRVVPCCNNQPLSEMFLSHFQRSTRAVQAKPAHLPGDILVLRDGVIHQERKVSHGYCLWNQWNLPVELDPFCRHCVNGHSGWGWGEVHCILIPSPHPDPFLSNKGRIRCKEGIHCRPLLFCPSAPDLLDPRLGCLSEGPGAPLVLQLTRRNHDVD